jgi:hypothetical protein
VSPYLASSPAHYFLKKVLDELSQVPAETLRTPPRTVGNRFLGELIKKWNPDVSIFPSYFSIQVILEQKDTEETAPY